MAGAVFYARDSNDNGRGNYWDRGSMDIIERRVARSMALVAARAEMDSSEQNVLGRNVAWRIVNAALDAYDSEWAHILNGQVTTAYAVVSTDPAIRPDVLPTERMAKRHLKRVAKETGRPRRQWRVVLVNTYLPR